MPKPCSSSTAPSTHCSVGQFNHLLAGVLCLHIASRHPITSGPRATTTKACNPITPSPVQPLDSSHPSATDSALLFQAAPSSTILPENTNMILPLTNQPTNPNTALPPALQAQPSSLMTQFLQYATPAKNKLVTCLLACPRPVSVICSHSYPSVMLPRPTTVTATTGHSTSLHCNQLLQLLYNHL